MLSGLILALALWMIPRVAAADWVQASGGDSVRAYRDGEGKLWQAHVFETIGKAKFQITHGGEVEYLIVAGGGAGGSSTHTSGGGASGGGGGGLVSGKKSVSVGSYEVVIGAGGEPVNEPGALGRNGGNSSIFGLVALGGGGGAGAGMPTGADGGSGGGGRHARGPGGKALQPSSEAGGHGFPGAAGARTSPDQGSGGGGAGGPGEVGSFRRLGAGGKGFVSAITGDLVTYACGGPGGSRAQTLQGSPGTMNRGDGGGGAAGGRSSEAWSPGGPGGSGVVVVRYQLPPPTPLLAEGGKVTDFQDERGITWRVHAFTADGYFKVLKSGFVEVLVVGGGGGGATTSNSKPAPGGDGGEVLSLGQKVTAGETYDMFVGVGGKGAPLSGRGTPGMDGDPSSAFGFSARGGLGGNPVAPSGLGGHGAGAMPTDANGGSGLVSKITGTIAHYGSGGGTAIETIAGRGARDAGDASIDGTPGKAGVANTGGGGGASNLNFAGGGDGGSGVVIVRYPLDSNQER